MVEKLPEVKERVMPKRGSTRKAAEDPQESTKARNVDEEALLIAAEKIDEVAGIAQAKGCQPVAAGSYKSLREDLKAIRRAGLVSEGTMEQLQDLLIQLEMRIFVLSGQPEVEDEDQEDDDDSVDGDDDDNVDFGTGRHKSLRLLRSRSAASFTSCGSDQPKPKAQDDMEVCPGQAGHMPFDG